MRTLNDIYKKMDPGSRKKIWIFVVAMVFVISGTVALILSDQQKAQERHFAEYQQQIMERLLQQQAAKQLEDEYTEEDFNEAKKNLPPVEELDFEPK